MYRGALQSWGKQKHNFTQHRNQQMSSPVVGAGVIIQMRLSIPLPFGWLLNRKAARVEVNISMAFLHWVEMAVHP